MIAAGDLSADERPEELAKYLSTVTSGMAVQASGGSTRAELERVAERALHSFPA